MELEQNTLAWHQHRKKYINASEVAAIMGLNPFETKEQLLQRKLFDLKITDNAAMQQGRILEPKARSFFNKSRNFNFKPKVFVKDFMSASLDGWDEKTQSLLEIKCPMSLNTLTWRTFLQCNKIPIFYYAQVQAQIYCSSSFKAYFLLYQNDQNHKTKEVLEDPRFIKEMIKECSVFFQLLQKSKMTKEQLKL
ncbi:lambda-exonuclease family protein [Candidatus Phytoplasma meliae]|uniref:YqaJ viral recombinase family protein n=1 Tax=Candidatus Phytoplasma meliae TaxID=1848402 RepID=A0ABS5CYS7_9MOLU|nr:YqaJ viral recombinase family protein [Candidatus Phytoplasma meliae]MBP5836124.1 YqaJ viral recombinase family protein [Candidatus Phytoplasma meliae]